MVGPILDVAPTGNFISPRSLFQGTPRRREGPTTSNPQKGHRKVRIDLTVHEEEEDAS